MPSEFTTLTSNFTQLTANIKKSAAGISTSVARLASGKQITQASDDVANLSISTKIDSRVKTLRSSINNLSQAGSMLQVMDGALGQVDSMLQRMLALSVMALSSTLSDKEKAYLSVELNNLRNEVDRMLKYTNFNGVSLFGQDAIAPEPKAVSVTAQIYSLDEVRDLPTGYYTIKAGDTVFTGYVERKDGESWLLVGRGREGWEFDLDGQGKTEDVINGIGTSKAFKPAAYDPAIINALMRESGAGLNDLEVRLKRAENITGSWYQEDRWRFKDPSASWTWNFDSTNQLEMEYEIKESSLGAPFLDVDSNTRDTSNTTGPDTANNYQRIFTNAVASHRNMKGFSYGAAVTGVNNNSTTSFLWEATTENNAIPYTEVYIRLNSTPQAQKQVESFVDPRSISGLVSWYDASDLDGDGIIEGVNEAGRTGSNMVTWKDKSISQHDMVQQGGAPQITAQINGMDVITFTNLTQGRAADSLGGTVSEMSVFYVMQEQVRDNNRFISFNGTNTANPGTPPTNTNSFFIRSPNANGSYYFDAGNTGSNRVFVQAQDMPGVGPTQVGDVVLVSATKSVSEGMNTLSLNGGTYFDRSATANAARTTGGLRVGINGAAGVENLAEMVVFNRKLTDEETAIVEAYLAQKWGVNNFNAGHEYANASPLKGLTLTLPENALPHDIVGSANVGFQNDVTYSIPYSDGMFTIDEKTGLISVKDATKLDFEKQQSHQIQVVVTGPSLGSAPFNLPVTVKVLDVPETVSFEVGSVNSNKLYVTVDNLNSRILFNGEPLILDPRERAEEAFKRVSEAIDMVTSRRAEVGSKQSAIDYLTNAFTEALRSMDSARAVLADADITKTSTEFSLQTVLNQVGISVEAQANNLHGEVVRGIISGDNRTENTPISINTFA